METKLFVATKAFIVNKQGKVLILCESNKYVDGTNVAKFDLPGGRMEVGKPFDECLIREIKEETGLKVKIGQPFYVGEWRPVVRGEQWQIVAIFFKCKTTTTQVKLSKDHDVFEWISPKDYKKSSLIPNLQRAFKAYLV